MYPPGTSSLHLQAPTVVIHLVSSCFSSSSSCSSSQSSEPPFALSFPRIRMRWMQQTPRVMHDVHPSSPIRPRDELEERQEDRSHFPTPPLWISSSPYTFPFFSFVLLALPSLFLFDIFLFLLIYFHLDVRHRLNFSAVSASFFRGPEYQPNLKPFSILFSLQLKHDATQQRITLRYSQSPTCK